MLDTRFALIFSFCLAPAAFAQDSDAIHVEFVTAETQMLVADMQLTGTIAAEESLELGFRQSGRVVEVLVREGDRVAEGDQLARLDSVQQDQALRVAQASLAAAVAAQDQAQLASDRASAMLARGVGTRAARDAAVQALSEADGAVERAESAVEQAARAVEDTVLRAPAGAVVTARDMAPGQIVGAAQPVLSVAVLNGMEAVFEMGDLPILRDAIGANVHLSVIEIDRPPMIGTVAEIAPLVDPVNGTVTVRVQIDGVQGDVALLGASVRGDFRLAGDSGIALPWTTLMRDGDRPAVWIVGGDGRVSLSPVEIRAFADGVVYLEAGIEAGQIVVGAGSQMLFPGRAVQRAEVTP